MRSKKYIFPIVLILLQVMIQNASAGFLIDHTSTDPAQIPDQWITAAKANLQIAYNHTSHGSQIITGLNALRDFPAFGTRYHWTNTESPDSSTLCLRDGAIPGQPDLSQGDVDTDGDGMADWAEDTYAYLTLKDTGGNFVHDDINVVMWSWCDIAGHNVNRYLSSMEWLIGLFSEGGTHERALTHPVQFVFMTAHANGGGELDSSDTPNRQIRQHCLEYDRILFDFSDIENYDPDGNYFLNKRLNDTLDYDSDNNGTRDRNWASEYLDRHPGSQLDQLTHGVDGYAGCSSCAHSDGGETDARLNCVLKGQAAWALFARLAGWGECTEPPADFTAVPDYSDPDHVNVVLSWSDHSSEEDYYAVERLSGAGSWTRLETLPAGATSYIDTDLAAGSHEYRVLAHKATGEGAPCDAISATRQVTIVVPVVPQSPSNLSADLTGADVTLTWQDNSDNEEHFVLFQSMDGGAFSEAAVLGQNVTTHVISNLSPFHEYGFRVLARNAIGDSGLSNIATVYVAEEEFTIRLDTPAEGVEDAFLMSAAPDTNYGNTQYLSSFNRFVIRFNLPAEILGKEIQSAKFSVYVWNVPQGTIGRQFNLYGVTRNWTGSAVTWNSSSPDGQGGLTSWTTPGGDLGEVAGILTMSNPANNYDHQYLGEVELKTLVQAWADGETPNYGVLLDAGSTPFGLKASEYGSGHSYLEITYSNKPACRADMDQDLDVDGMDLAIFAGQFNPGCLGESAKLFGK
ncbi:MAG: DNRLRE domain-containing protein [Desulfobacula sp.]|jgi:hypothetical protein